MDATDLEEVVVTGSRIPDAPGASGAPIVMIDRSDVRRLGTESLGQVLQQLPMNSGSPANTNQNAAREDRGGDGSTRIDLRGLGAERTLVLIDGRRFVAGGLGGDAAADLGMIPLAAVERIEVLGAGASTVYGADAIGGVVNVVTRRGSPEAPEALVTGTVASRGDGGTASASLIGAYALAHGVISGGLEWYGQQGVWMRDRRYSREREALLADGSAIAFGLAQTPQGVFRVPTNNRLGLPSGIYTRVEGSGEPTEAADFRAFVDPDDRYNPNEDEYLRTPLQRYSVWLNGDHELGDGMRLGWSSWLHQRQSEQTLRPAPIDTRFGIGVPTLETGLPGIPASNLYNPFGVNLRDVRRRVVEAGRRHFEQDVGAARLVVTLEGQGGSDWAWDISAGWSRNDTDQVTKGELRSDRTAIALGPSGLDDAGRPVCGRPDPQTGRVAAADVIAGCVPLNVFGGQGPNGLGTIDAAQIEYVTGTFHDQGRNEQWIASGGAHGRFGELPAGSIGWAAGVDLRRESGFQRPDPDKQVGVAGSVEGSLAGGGDYNVTEAYGEVRVPLVANRPALERLDADLGVRWSRFSSFGNTSSLSGRVRWQPLQAVTVWAAYSDVFRAPSLASLYTSDVHYLGPARDPCGNDPTPQQRITCAANGVPGGGYEQPLLDQIPTVRGGNAELQPEEGRSWSAGLAWSPDGIGFTLSVDYFDTVVNAAIRQLLDQTLLDECANTGAASVCERIRRWPDGTVQEVDARYINLGSETATGVDVEARHRVSWHGGSVGLRLLATHLIDRSITTAPGSPPLEIAGAKFERSLYPEWRGVAGLEYARGPWTAGYSAEYIDGVRECSSGTPALPGLLAGCRQVSDVLYHDLLLSYAARRGWTVSVLASNVTDEEPPRVAFVPAEGNTSTVTYRLLGRTYSMQFRLGVD
jgi:outer membrane receptor protein involved in Fe transport